MNQLNCICCNPLPFVTLPPAMSHNIRHVTNITHEIKKAHLVEKKNKENLVEPVTPM